MVTAILACSGRPAPIYDRSANPYRRTAESDTRVKRPSYYTVRRGDTLYAIAWRYGLDYKTLARWNRIGPPYTIFPDDRLQLFEPRQSAEPERTVVETRPAPPRQPTTRPTQPVESDASRGRSTPAPAANRPAPTPAERPPPAVSAKPTPADDAPLRWQWPADGPVLSTFASGDASRKGINIGGEVGADVRAASAGEVVYSGSGLVGYGELIIIKHNERFLSAYGHNRRRLVAEGDRVQAGQKIAELGKTGTNRAMLHFEIRDDGRPVNPQSHLPRR